MSDIRAAQSRDQRPGSQYTQPGAQMAIASETLPQAAPLGNPAELPMMDPLPSLPSLPMFLSDDGKLFLSLNDVADPNSNSNALAALAAHSPRPSNPPEPSKPALPPISMAGVSMAGVWPTPQSPLPVSSVLPPVLDLMPNQPDPSAAQPHSPATARISAGGGGMNLSPRNAGLPPGPAGLMGLGRGPAGIPNAGLGACMGGHPGPAPDAGHNEDMGEKGGDDDADAGGKGQDEPQSKNSCSCMLSAAVKDVFVEHATAQVRLFNDMRQDNADGIGSRQRMDFSHKDLILCAFEALQRFKTASAQNNNVVIEAFVHFKRERNSRSHHRGPLKRSNMRIPHGLVTNMCRLMLNSDTKKDDKNVEFIEFLLLAAAGSIGNPRIPALLSVEALMNFTPPMLRTAQLPPTHPGNPMLPRPMPDPNMLLDHMRAGGRGAPNTPSSPLRPRRQSISELALDPTSLNLKHNAAAAAFAAAMKQQKHPGDLGSSAGPDPERLLQELANAANDAHQRTVMSSPLQTDKWSNTENLMTALARINTPPGFPHVPPAASEAQAHMQSPRMNNTSFLLHQAMKQTPAQRSMSNPVHGTKGGERSPLARRPTAPPLHTLWDPDVTKMPQPEPMQGVEYRAPETESPSKRLRLQGTPQQQQQQSQQQQQQASQRPLMDMLKSPTAQQQLAEVIAMHRSGNPNASQSLQYQAVHSPLPAAVKLEGLDVSLMACKADAASNSGIMVEEVAHFPLQPAGGGKKRHLVVMTLQTAASSPPLAEPKQEPHHRMPVAVASHQQGYPADYSKQPTSDAVPNVCSMPLPGTEAPQPKAPKPMATVWAQLTKDLPLAEDFQQPRIRGLDFHGAGCKRLRPDGGDVGNGPVVTPRQSRGQTPGGAA